MNKAILKSLRPNTVVNILNGDASILITKQCPKCDLPIDVYIYCTKGNKKDWHLIEVVDTDTGWEGYEYDYYIGSKGYLDWCLEGKVVAKFTLRKVEEIECAIDYDHEWGRECTYHTDSMCQEVLGECSCLYNDIDEYLDWKPDNIVGYAYHIEDLVIFDKPKELSEFKKSLRCPVSDCRYCKYNKTVEGDFYCKQSRKLTKAPQSYVFVESED